MTSEQKVVAGSLAGAGLAWLLPTASGPGTSVQGQDIRGQIPDLLNRRIPASARPGIG